MSVMVGGVTESLTADEAFVQGLNATVDDARVQVAYTLSFLVGLFQVHHTIPLAAWTYTVSSCCSFIPSDSICFMISAPLTFPDWPTGGAGPGALRLCGHLPVGASGP